MNDITAYTNNNPSQNSSAKSFDEMICDVEINTERRAFLTAYDGRRFHDAKSLEATVKLVKTVFQSEKKYISIKIVDATGESRIVDTDKEKDYFDGLVGKKVYISGIKTHTGKDEKWYIISCYDVTDREQLISESELFSEEEKRRFQISVQDFAPSIQRDLARRKIWIAQMEADKAKAAEKAKKAGGRDDAKLV